MSDNNFFDKIMIYSPISTYKKAFCYEDLEDKSVKSVSEFIDLVKRDAFEFLGAYGAEELNIYIDFIYILKTLYSVCKKINY